MKDRKILKKLQSDNKGAAIVTVIVAVAFICVLTTLISYLSIMNYQMKSTDFKTKVSFYGAEVPLEELKVYLAEDMSTCAYEAYKSTMLKYSTLPSADLRSAEYKKVMWQEMQEIWNTRKVNPLGNDAVTDPEGWCYAIATLLKEQYNNTNYPKQYHVILDDALGTVLHCGNDSCPAKYHVIVKNLGNDQLKLVSEAGDDHMVLSGIKVSYTENSFTSVISTDFCMYIPTFDWSVDAFSPTWDVDGTTSRTQIFYEKCVVFMNYVKQ